MAFSGGVSAWFKAHPVVAGIALGLMLFALFGSCILVTAKRLPGGELVHRVVSGAACPRA